MKIDRLNKKELSNTIARGVFAAGGISVLLILFLIIFFLAKETFPIFSGVKVSSVKEYPSPEGGSPLAGLISPEAKLAILLYPDGKVYTMNAVTGEILSSDLIDKSVKNAKASKSALYIYNGREIAAYKVNYELDPATGLENGAKFDDRKSFPVNAGDLTSFSIAEDSEKSFAALFYKKNKISYIRRETVTDLSGNDQNAETKWSLDLPDGIDAVEAFTDSSIAITSGKKINIYQKDGTKLYELDTDETSASGRLIGGSAILLGTKKGSVDVWSFANTDSGSAYFKIHTLEVTGTPITKILSSQRDRTFVTIDADGYVNFCYSTNERKLLRFKAQPDSQFLLSPKGNVLIEAGKSLTVRNIHNPHPDVSVKALFGKVWYEGYPAPAYVWQSSGGSDEFESKYSLIPLLLGTVKGAIFALFFAIPLALCGAIFMNQFMHPSLHKFIKPVIEVMAGLPSVIIGFIGGLWLAPVLEKVLPGVLLGLIITPIAVVVIMLLIDKRILSTGIDLYKKEIFIMIPVIAVVFTAAVLLTPFVNNILFAGDFRQFFYNKFMIPYDQRNAIVVGFAMGFAVIPIIFSLAEDAISFVPKEIIAGSLSLGLSRWQTVSGVVLKAARSGIITAVMIGFGRAVGETMIVLMATGNTPVLSMSPFNGFRSLSATIAVELPEAAAASSHWRILFLCALVLFLFTFVINAVTDIVRSNMKKRMQ